MSLQAAAGISPALKRTPGGMLIQIRKKVRAAAADQPAGAAPPSSTMRDPRAVPGLPAPYTEAQIGQRAQGEIDPILQRITSAIESRARSAGSAITGYSDSLAKSAAAVDYGAPYATAIPMQASVDAALHQSLAGEGTALASDLKTRLAQIGEAGVVDPAAAAIEARGVAAGNTELARGSSNLGSLIAMAAGAKEYGAKLPGIAKLAGLQDIAGANSAAQQQIADQTADVTKQLPSILSDLRRQSDTRATNIVSQRDRKTALDATNARAQATVDAANARSDASQREKAVNLILKYGVDPATGQLSGGAQKLLGKVGIDPGALTGLSGSNVTSRLTNANTVAHADARSANSIAATDARAAAKLAADRAKITAKSKAPINRSLISDATKQARDLATEVAPKQHYTDGEPSDVPGTGKKAASYSDALAQITALGPATPEWKKKAQQIVEAQYKPGDSGRPYPPAQAKNIALANARAALKKGIPFRDAVQVAINKSGGSVPTEVIQAAFARVYFSGPFSPVSGSPHFGNG